MPLIKRGIAVGDTGADFDAFVVRRYAALVRFGYVLTGNRASAEDLVQNALFRTYRRWQHLDAKDDPTAYVRKAMVNAHISWARLLSAREQFFAEPPERPGGRRATSRDCTCGASSPPCRPGCAPSWSCASTRTCPKSKPRGCWAVRSEPSRARTSRGLARLRRELSQPESTLTPPGPTAARSRRLGGEKRIRADKSFIKKPFVAMEES